MKILNDGVWNWVGCQFRSNRFALMIGLFSGAVLEMVAICSIARAAESKAPPLVKTTPDALTQTIAGVAPLQFATADSRAPSSTRSGHEPIAWVAAGTSHPRAASAEVEKRPAKRLPQDAEARTRDSLSPNFEGPFAPLAVAEAGVPARVETAPPRPEVSAASALAVTHTTAAEPPEPGHAAALAQVPDESEAAQIPPADSPIADYQPLLEFQAATVFQDDELSGRLRTTALYALNEQVLFGATVDLVGGDAFVDSADEGLSLNELYVAAAPFHNEPNLRFIGGLIDLTSYFDRNSFAKDVVTHFFHPVFQTNPALSAAGLASRPGLLVNWSATDQLEVKAAAFSSSRDWGELAVDGFAAEAGFRTGNLIVRGTFAIDRDAGDDTGFNEIFQIQRGDGSFGPRDDDREIAYGINAEYFIDAINLGLFGRYGWYENQDIDRSGITFSLGANALDVFLSGDRLGLGYGQQLSNSDLRSGKTPDVWEVFYDAPVYSQVRVGVSLQSRDEFSDTGLGLRVRADW